MTTPLGPASAAREAPTSLGRGQPPAATDDAFGAILSEVAQDEAPSPSAAERGDASAGAGPVAARTLAPAAGQPLTVDAWLAQLAIRADITGAPTDGSTAVTSPSATARASKTHKDKSRPDGALDDALVPAIADRPAIGAGVAAAAATLATQVVAGPAASVAVPQDGAPLPAVQMRAQPASTAAKAGDANEAEGQATPSMPITLAEVATHLAPSRALPQPPSATASLATGDTGSAQARSEAATLPAAAAPATPDADGKAHAGEVEGKDGAGAADRTAASPLAAAAATSPAVRQITEAVNTLAAETTSSDPGTAQASAAKPSPTRSLILHLAPATLGTITVRLHLGDGGLSVRLAVEKETTLGLISHARETLQSVLGATYKLDQLIIQGADVAPLPNAGSHDATTRSDSGALADQQSGGQRGHEEAPRRQHPVPPRASRADGAGRADGLFV